MAIHGFDSSSVAKREAQKSIEAIEKNQETQARKRDEARETQFSVDKAAKKDDDIKQGAIREGIKHIQEKAQEKQLPKNPFGIR